MTERSSFLETNITFLEVTPSSTVCLTSASPSNTREGSSLSCCPSAFADVLFSTLDFVSLYRTFAIYTRHVVRELLLGKI